MNSVQRGGEVLPGAPFYLNLCREHFHVHTGIKSTPKQPHVCSGGVGPLLKTQGCSVCAGFLGEHQEKKTQNHAREVEDSAW